MRAQCKDARAVCIDRQRVQYTRIRVAGLERATGDQKGGPGLGADRIPPRSQRLHSPTAPIPTGMRGSNRLAGIERGSISSTSPHHNHS